LPVLTVTADCHRARWDAAVAGDGWRSANTPIRRRDVTGVNLHPHCRSADPAPPDLLLTAHYDGVGDVAGLRLPGAADNASGVAVILEAARLLEPVLPAGPGLSVAVLDAEEVGALGSAHHAAQPLLSLGAITDSVRWAVPSRRGEIEIHHGERSVVAVVDPTSAPNLSVTARTSSSASLSGLATMSAAPDQGVVAAAVVEHRHRGRHDHQPGEDEHAVADRHEPDGPAPYR